MSRELPPSALLEELRAKLIVVCPDAYATFLGGGDLDLGWCMASRDWNSTRLNWFDEWLMLGAAKQRNRFKSEEETLTAFLHWWVHERNK